jgi:hypothetical protein
LQKSGKISSYLAARNLWNLSQLHYEGGQEIIEFLTNAIVENKQDINEFDAANVMKALSHFDYVHYDCLELMLKFTISKAH